MNHSNPPPKYFHTDNIRPVIIHIFIYISNAKYTLILYLMKQATYFKQKK